MDCSFKRLIYVLNLKLTHRIKFAAFKMSTAFILSAKHSLVNLNVAKNNLTVSLIRVIVIQVLSKHFKIKNQIAKAFMVLTWVFLIFDNMNNKKILFTFVFFCGAIITF